MKRILFLLFALALPLAAQTVQTSDATLKSWQNPHSGWALYNDLTDADADNNLFISCTFAGGNIGTESHPLHISGICVFNPAFVSAGLNAYAIGNVSLVYVTGGGEGDTNFTMGGTTDGVSLDNLGDGYEVDILQNTPLTVSINTGSGPGTLNANSVTSLTLSFWQSGFNGASCTISATACTSADFTGYLNAGSDTAEFILGCDPLLPTGINAGGENDTWSGPFSATFVDNLFVAYDNGGSSGSSITTTGSSAAPTSASAAARADLISNGCTITTN